MAASRKSLVICYVIYHQLSRFGDKSVYIFRRTIDKGISNQWRQPFKKINLLVALVNQYNVNSTDHQYTTDNLAQFN